MKNHKRQQEIDLNSLRRQLADARENLCLIEERKAKYTLSVDIPLQLIKEERRLRARITKSEKGIAEYLAAQKSDPIRSDGIRLQRIPTPIWVAVLGTIGVIVVALMIIAVVRLQPPVLVGQDAIENGKTKSFSVDLANDEVIVGEAWMFNQDTNKGRGCIVFLMRGPNHYDFVITAGQWYKYKNVSNSEQVESLISERTQYLVNYAESGCTNSNVLTIRLPLP